MKKYVTIMLILFACLLSLIYNNIKNNDNDSIILGDTLIGDVDGNGSVGASDYKLVRKHVLKMIELKGEQLSRANVDGKSGVTSGDYIMIRKIILGLINPTPKPTITSTPVPTAVPTPAPPTKPTPPATPTPTTIPSSNSIDLVLLWGQSNMQGSVGYSSYEKGNNAGQLKGIDSDIVSHNISYGYVTVDIPNGVAFEYKYFSNSLVDVSSNPKTFGETSYYDNGKLTTSGKQDSSLSASLGTNIIPYFAKEYYEKTGNKAIYIMGARGAYDINSFLPGSSKGTYNSIIIKFRAAEAYARQHGYEINNRFYIVYQGESDMYDNKVDQYAATYKIVHDNLMKDLGISFGAIVKMVRGDLTCDTPLLNPIRAQQDKLINENSSIIEGTDFLYKEYCEKGNNTLFGVKNNDYNNSIHANSAALSQVGRDVAKHITSSGKVNTLFNSAEWQKTSLNNVIVNSQNATTTICGLAIQNGRMGYYSDCNELKYTDVTNGCAAISLNSCNKKQTLNYYLESGNSVTEWNSVSNIGAYLILGQVYNQWLYAGAPALNNSVNIGFHVAHSDSLSIGIKNIGEVAIKQRVNDDNLTFINYLYKAILGRAADDNGLNVWQNSLNNGVTKSNVLIGFVESNEVRAIYSAWGYN